MVRVMARGYSKGTSEPRLWTRITKAAIQMTNQGRAVMVAIVRECGDGCCWECMDVNVTKHESKRLQSQSCNTFVWRVRRRAGALSTTALDSIGPSRIRTRCQTFYRSKTTAL